MHKRVFNFVLLFLLCFGLAIGSKFGFNPTADVATAALPASDAMIQLLLNPDVNLETNNWFELTAKAIAKLDFNQAIDKAIAPSLLPDMLSDILSHG